MGLAVSNLHFQDFPLQLSGLHATFLALRYAANQTQIRLERMAYLTLRTLRTLAFDGGRLCDGGRGICRCSSTDTPRHQRSSLSHSSPTILQLLLRNFCEPKTEGYPIGPFSPYGPTIRRNAGVRWFKWFKQQTAI